MTLIRHAIGERSLSEKRIKRIPPRELKKINVLKDWVVVKLRRLAARHIPQNAQKSQLTKLTIFMKTHLDKAGDNFFPVYTKQILYHHFPDVAKPLESAGFDASRKVVQDFVH